MLFGSVRLGSLECISATFVKRIFNQGLLAPDVVANLPREMENSAEPATESAISVRIADARPPTLLGRHFSYVKKPNDLWTEVARCMREGTSCRKTALELGIAVSTVFRWRHKILAALRERTDMIAVLHGIIEADETMFTRSYKGSHIEESRRSRCAEGSIS